MTDSQLLADEAFRRKDFGAAAAHLQRHLEVQPEDIQAWMKLAVIHRASGQPRSALTAVDRALAIQPLFYLALLMKASLLEAVGQLDRAAELYAAALFHKPDGQIPAAVLQQLRKGEAFVASRAADVETTIKQACLRSGVADQDRAITSFVDAIYRRKPVYRQEPTHYRWPGLADIPFFDDHDLAWMRCLAEKTDIIREEFETVSRSVRGAADPYVRFDATMPVGQWSALNHSSDWSAIHLIRHGIVNEDHARYCPETLRTFAESNRQPDIPGLTPNLMFSILAPHTHIPPHHGVANFRSVLHLPLVVPEGCRFRVGGEERPWRVGEPWMFDDTIEHEAWNDSDQPRVILIADMWRTELSRSARSAVRHSLASMAPVSDLGTL